MDEKDRVVVEEDALKVGDDGTWCIDLFEDEIVDAAARRKVDEGRVDDVVVVVASIREASTPRFLDATVDDMIYGGRRRGRLCTLFLAV